MESQQQEQNGWSFKSLFGGPTRKEETLDDKFDDSDLEIEFIKKFPEAVDDKVLLYTYIFESKVIPLRAYIAEYPIGANGMPYLPPENERTARQISYERAALYSLYGEREDTPEMKLAIEEGRKQLDQQIKARLQLL